MNDLSKDAVNRVAVGDEAAGQRVDNYLVKILKGVPKSHIYRILRSGEVRVNKARVGPDTRLAAGDVLRIPPIRAAAPERRHPAPVGGAATVPPILYEDDDLLAIDKPSGLAVHGGSGISHGVIERLRHARPEAKVLELVHRLDRDTSGVLLIAKRRPALIGLHAQLREGSVDKRYYVLVRGKWRDEKRAVDLALETYVTADGERRVRVDRDGRAARTIFRRSRTWPKADPPVALLEAELETGRTHQIRVHLTHLGFPLAGDDKYGDFAWNKALGKVGLKRMFLHAFRVRFAHPVDGREIVVESPLPPDLAGFVARLDAAESADG
ncbi:MAG: RluA family pseudouridine synthase [Betaproteobacteria bacterium]